jgi:hypothetical protein
MEKTMSVTEGLVQLIENNSDRLAETMLMKLQSCEKCESFRHVPREEFRQRVYEIYDHLGEWLLDKKEAEVARRYVEIGVTREKQNVLLSELMYAIIMTREHLWEFLKQEAKIEKPKEVFGELEVMELLEQFFDRAMYYAAQGYEQSAGKTGREAAHAVVR